MNRENIFEKVLSGDGLKREISPLVAGAISDCNGLLDGIPTVLDPVSDKKQREYISKLLDRLKEMDRLINKQPTK